MGLSAFFLVIIQTQRLILREFRVSDIDVFARILAKPEVMRFSPTGALSKLESAEKLSGYIQSKSDRGFGKWAVIHRETTQLIGYCGIAVEYIEGKEENELGYRLDPEFWGMGLATEAASACLQYAFDVLNKHQVLGIVEPENSASVRTLEKLGMVFQKETLWSGKLVRVYKVVNSNYSTP